MHPSAVLAPTHAEAEVMARQAAAANLTNLDAVRDDWVIGNPREVTSGLRAYFDVGVSHFVFGTSPPFDLGPLRLLQEEVFPALN